MRASRTILSWGFGFLLVVKAFGAPPVKASDLHFILLGDPSPPVCGLHIWLAQAVSDKEQAPDAWALPVDLCTSRTIYIYTLAVHMQSCFFHFRGVGLPPWLSQWRIRLRCRRHRKTWVGKIPGRRAWQPTPVFLPGEFHGQSSLEGYSPWGHESQTWPSN